MIRLPHIILAIIGFLMMGSVGQTLAPQRSWDSHLHVIDPQKYPLAPDRDYTPKAATKEDARQFHHSISIDHGVIVLPSVYDTNNSILLDALRYFNGTYRGVCVLDLDTGISNETMEEYHEAGIRGIRINYGNDGSDAEIASDFLKAAAIARRKDWVVELWVPIRAFQTLHSIIPTQGVRVVADHYAHAQVASRTGNPRDTIDPFGIPGFSEVIDLIKNHNLFVKISAPYQNSKKAPLYDDMRVIAETLMLNGPDMVVFGSDWPHTSSKEGNKEAGGRLQPQNFRDINDTALIEEVKGWAVTEAQIQRLFVDNPRRLWDWEDLNS